MSLLSNNTLAGSSGQGGGGYEIERSLRFNSGDSADLRRVHASGGSKSKFTISCWLKKCKSGDNNFLLGRDGSFGVYVTATDKLHIDLYAENGSSWAVLCDSQAVLRDFSAWYHIVVVLDTSAGTTNADRIKFWLNGVQQTFDFTVYWGGLITGNIDSFNDNASHSIGSRNGSYYGNSYLAGYYFIDGQALAPSDFGEYDLDNVWQPIEFAGTYGWFNNSQTWSTLVTGTLETTYGNSSAAAPFQGSTGSSYADGIRPTGGNYLSMNFGSTFASATKVTIYGHASLDGAAYNGANENLKINGTALTAAEWANSGGGTGSGQQNATFTLASGLTSLEWGYSAGSQSTGYLYLQAIEVDGKLLVNSGVTITDNSFHLDFSDTSSNAALGTDTSGNGNTWTVNNLVTSSTTGFNLDVSSSPFVDVGTSQTITNVGTTVSTTTAATNSFNLTTVANFTVAGYIKTSSMNIPSNYTIDYFYDSAGTQAHASVNVVFDFGTNDLQDYADSTGNSHSFAGFAYTAASGWNHVRVSNTGVWVNGTRLGNSPSGIPGSSGKVLTLGAYSDGNYKWNGRIGPFRVAAKDLGAPPSGGLVANSNGKLSTITAANADSDALRDSPSQIANQTDTGVGGKVIGNYATLNPLHKSPNTTLSNGNLDLVNTTTWGTTVSTIGMSSGKWYAEVTITGTLNYPTFGVSSLNSAYTTSYFGQTADSYVWFGYSGAGLFTAGAYTNNTGDWVVNSVAGDVIGLALDMDNGTLKYYRNGTLLGGGNAFTGITGTQFFATCGYGHTENWNFGQRAFAYPVSGYKALCTANLPDPTVADGSKYFDTYLYTGDSSASQALTLPFEPGMMWHKMRSAASSHYIHDATRGFANNKAVSPNSTATEGVNSAYYSLSLSGTTLTAGDTGGGNEWNSNNTFVNWLWDAGSSNTTIAAGGLNSSVYDQSQTWSNAITSNVGFLSAYPVTKAFDGTFQGNGGAASSTDVSPTFTFTPPASITVTSLEFNCYTSCTLTLPDGSTQTIAGVTTNNTDVAANIGSGFTFTGSNSITLSRTSGHLYLERIKINGKELVDSGVTVANVPSIASTVRANPNAGFSIVKWNNGTISSTASVGHGLNAEPAFYVIKSLGTDSWYTYHKSTGNAKYLILNGTLAATTSATMWGNTSPTTDTFPVGTTFNGTGDYIAYCFAPVKSYSSMGSYVGNGSADGPFVFTGFKPAFILIKATAGSEDWAIVDSKRLGHNSDNYRLFASSSVAEAAATYLDILSNGFKLTSASGNVNSSMTYIYAAFASHPFKTSRAR